MKGKPDPEPVPEVGERFRMPDGKLVEVRSWAADHTGVRVNEVRVWDRPAPPAPPAFTVPMEDASNG